MTYFINISLNQAFLRKKAVEQACKPDVSEFSVQIYMFPPIGTYIDPLQFWFFALLLPPITIKKGNLSRLPFNVV